MPVVCQLVVYIELFDKVVLDIYCFSCAALNTGRSSHDKAVRPSVKCVICDKLTETCAHILTPHERSFVLVL